MTTAFFPTTSWRHCQLKHLMDCTSCSSCMLPPWYRYFDLLFDTPIQWPIIQFDYLDWGKCLYGGIFSVNLVTCLARWSCSSLSQVPFEQLVDRHHSGHVFVSSVIVRTVCTYVFWTLSHIIRILDSNRLTSLPLLPSYLIQLYVFVNLALLHGHWLIDGQ